METMIAFSHLRWDFVYQRPQHLLSRLAKHYRILFLEEPDFQQGRTGMSVSNPVPNVTVCRPITPLDKPAYDEEQLPYVRKLLQDMAPGGHFHTAWFYTPMMLPLLEGLETEWIVYDCMDELSLFRNPPPRLLEQEDALLQMADIVFTGGPSLYHAKKHRHPDVHCFPSSVDVSHFRQALDRNIADPEQMILPRPRLGFYGVIDERLDTGLIGDMADAHPDWQIMLAGPVADKMDRGELPQRPNIRYLGQQSYSTLPSLLAAWDVCLIPFAMNEATRFISPTKTLEYMAAELPIVSTPIRDVVDLHRDVVEIAASPPQFIAACERALNMPDDDMLEKIRIMRAKLARTSWDATAADMRILLQQMQGRRLSRAGKPAAAGSAATNSASH